MRFVGVKDVPINALVSYPGNARIHNEAALDESAEVNGQYRSIVARVMPDGEMQVLAGHGTRDAFHRRGETTVRVELIEADDTEALRINLADNGTSRLASYDERLLAELLATAEDGAGFAGTGWDEDAYRDLVDNLVPDIAPDSDSDDFHDEPPPEPVTRAGDIWLLGAHRIACGDCRDSKVVANLMQGVPVNVAFTSPPYADRREYDETSGFKPIPPDEYVEWFAPVAAIVRSILATDGSWFVNIKPGVTPDGLDTELYVLDLVAAHVRRWGWHFATEYCWERNGVPKSVTRRFKNQFEPVYQFTINDWKMRPDSVRHHSANVPVPGGPGSGDTGWSKDQGGNGPIFGAAKRRKNGTKEVMSNVQGVSTAPGEFIGAGMAYPGNRLPTFAGTHTATGHTAAFPVGLPAFFINAYTDAGDVIYDPFMGSGSTLIASQQEGRISYGCEISPAYCDLIARRYQELTGEIPVLERTGEPHDFG